MSDEIKILSITALETHNLRHTILRPHQSLEEMTYPGDQNPEAFHLEATSGDEQVGIVSVFPETLDSKQEGVGEWRLRGMAVVEKMRGKKVGHKLMDSVFATLHEKQASLLWCNARTSAIGYYLSLGFETRGEEFEIPGIGPHYIAIKRLT